MIKFFSKITLYFFDYFHKKKIIKFLKKSNIFSINTFLDIGAHKGESIDFFSKNLQIKKIYSFEASLSNFKILKKKYKNSDHVVLENIALSSNISKLNLINVMKVHLQLLALSTQIQNIYKKNEIFECFRIRNVF